MNAIDRRFMDAFIAGVLGGAIIVGWLSMRFSNKQQKDNIENN